MDGLTADEVLASLLKRHSHTTLLKSINEEKLLSILARAPGVLLPSDTKSEASEPTPPKSDDSADDSPIEHEKSEDNDYLDNLLKAKSRNFSILDSTVSSISESVVSEVPSEPPSEVRTLFTIVNKSKIHCSKLIL